MLSLAFFLTAASAASIRLAPRALPPASSPPNGWTYSGCYADDVSNRALKRSFQSVDNQSGAQCINYCTNLGYDVAGTENGRECFCDWDNNAVKADENDCSQPCNGNSAEACGAPFRLSIYQAPNDVPITNPGDGSTFKYVGCYPDSRENRLLPSEPLSGSTVTVARCINACRSAGFSSNATSTAYAGAEYGQALRWSKQAECVRCRSAGDHGYDYGAGFDGYDYGADFDGYDYGVEFAGYDYGVDFDGYDYSADFDGYDYSVEFPGYDYGVDFDGYDYGVDFAGYDYGVDFAGYDYGADFDVNDFFFFGRASNNYSHAYAYAYAFDYDYNYNYDHHYN
ncbi:WSC-domain-containing protein [Karstenula rhodostoma CBS 690.94]|uniref:WSC-domain-containing protein n=1 Tax=Karstenula rhodostoma CBS 690.94 TaxID=1392251 RepID=A0A9P4PG62_9PLEO|nr:WSC-domain-containing protein [Karstenula rhodostoma CBS 690.94]